MNTFNGSYKEYEQPLHGTLLILCYTTAFISFVCYIMPYLGERGREYFLNFIDRRAIESGHQKLKIEAHFYPE
jgi:hypothetical protein